MASTVSNLGRAIDDILSSTIEGDRLGSASQKAADRMADAEDVASMAWASSDTVENRKTLAEKLYGHTFAEKDLPSLYALQSAANQKNDITQRALSAILKLKERTQEILMQIIQTIGR